MQYRRLGFLLIVIGTLGLAYEARADLTLEAAQVCYSETGVDNQRECAAVLESLRARALLLHRPFRTHLRLYSGEALNRHRTDPRAWLAFLRADAREPERWPVRASWAVRRASWRGLLTFVRRWLARPWNPCSATPEDWGHGARVIHRYRTSFPQAVTLECGLGPGRHNTFLRRYPYDHETDPHDPHNQANSSPKERGPIPRVTLGFGSRGTCQRSPNLGDKDLISLP